MSRSLFVLSDGTQIFSGVGMVPAVKTVTYKAEVVSESDLNYGAACAAMVEGSLIDTSGTFSVEAGQEFSYYEVDDDGTQVLYGQFRFEKPTKPSPNTYKFIAYDRMTLFDWDITDWLAGLTEWPYTIRTLLELICQESGVALADDFELVNGEYAVEKFLQRVTARKLVQWVAGANAMYAFMTPEGKLSFGRFKSADALAAEQRSLSVSDYSTASIQKVVVKQDEDDVGVSWPVEAEGETYTILSNPLLTTFSTENLQPCVEQLAEHLLGLSYTPLEAKVCSASAKLPCKAGQIVAVTDRNGIRYTTAIFSVSRTGAMITVKSTGNTSRGTSIAAAEKDMVEVLQGRVAKIKTSLEEVSVEMEQTKVTAEQAKMESSSVKQNVESITAQVTVLEQTAEKTSIETSVLTQKAGSLELSIKTLNETVSGKADAQTVEEFSKHFHFGADGLTIFNSATGMGIGVSEERVAFTGGAQDPTTVITPTEMETTNLRVGQRLDLGDFALLPRTNGNLSMRWTGD